MNLQYTIKVNHNFWWDESTGDQKKYSSAIASYIKVTDIYDMSTKRIIVKKLFFFGLKLGSLPFIFNDFRELYFLEK